MILPYLEQNALFLLNPQTGGTGGNGTGPVKAFLCPGRSRINVDSTNHAITDYAENAVPFGTAVGASGWFRQQVTLVNITDGTSNTIFVGEKGLCVASYTAPAGGWDDDAFRSWGGCNRAGWWVLRDVPASQVRRHLVQ